MAPSDVALVAALPAIASLLSGCSFGGSNAPDYCADTDHNTALHQEATKVFALDDAVMHAELATAAYCGSSSQIDNKAINTWDCGAPCEKFKMSEVRVVTSDSDNDAFAFVAKTAPDFTWSGGGCILSFRGTTNAMGWAQDLLSAGHAKLGPYTDVQCQVDGTTCQVGLGWRTVYASYNDYIKGNLSEIGCGLGDGSITVTGHSLGAAQVGLAMLDLKQAGYDVLPTFNFGSPRIGDSTFNTAFNAALSPLHLFRVTNYKDPVPHVPPESFGYHHLDMEVYFGSGMDTVSKGYLIGDGTGEDPCGADQFGNSTEQIVALVALCGLDMKLSSGCNHLTYLQQYTKHPMTGAACTYPSSTAYV